MITVETRLFEKHQNELLFLEAKKTYNKLLIYVTEETNKGNDEIAQMYPMLEETMQGFIRWNKGERPFIIKPL